MSVGGCVGDWGIDERRRGRTACEKKKPPLLEGVSKGGRAKKRAGQGTSLYHMEW
jgi:hypothetical protein